MQHNFQQQPIALPYLKIDNPLDALVKGIKTETNEIHNLKRKINEHQMQVEVLIKILQPQQSIIQQQRRRYIQKTLGNEQYNNELFDEIKKLKRKLKKIEKGPQVPLYSPMLFPQQHYLQPILQCSFPQYVPNQNFQQSQLQQQNQYQRNEENTLRQILKKLVKIKENEKKQQIFLRLLLKDQDDIA